MTLRPEVVRDIIDHVIQNVPQLKTGDAHYRSGYRTFVFSSHHFIEQYRKRHPRAYADLLIACSHSRLGQDRDAHGQIAACFGRYAKGREELRKIGRRALSRDVHGNMVRPMWWRYRERI